MQPARTLPQTPSPGDRSIRLDCLPDLPAVPALARQSRRAWGLEPSSRLDLDRVCNRLEIEVSEVSMNVPGGGPQGFLFPKPKGGFLIEIDPEPPCGWAGVPSHLRESLARHRKRFLIAHELVHTLFYDHESGEPQRLLANSARQERFCDELARALLVPPQSAAEVSLSPTGATEIADRFDVSMEIALRSLIATHRDSAVGWLLLPRGEKTVVQWTSADSRLTSISLHALRALTRRAMRTGTAQGRLGGGGLAHATFLQRRSQVIVTCDYSSSS